MEAEKKQILYVDDEPENLTVFKSTFRRFYEIFTANSAAEGIEYLAKYPNITVIITDQRMPKMTGVEFLRVTSEKYPAPSRIIMTGYSDIEVIIEAINSFDIFRYITKPWNKDELKMAIDSGIDVYNLKMENKYLVRNLQKANQELKEYSQSLEEKVRERTKELEKTNRLIIDSIQYAKKIQRAILPSKELLKKYLSDIFILYKPRDIVSGDFYWLAEVDNYVFLAVVDCTGHGVPGGFMSMIGYSLLNEIVKSKKLLCPSEVLDELNLKVL
ncbi:MAG: response regulator, partial [Bacteroidia bacterium]|nr:response regulator [Bacteroidia bacterium]